VKKLAPGCYEDESGALHIDCAEFLAASGWPDTPENRERIVQFCRDYCRDQNLQCVEAE
jgi:hypothetical protein